MALQIKYVQNKSKIKKGWTGVENLADDDRRTKMGRMDEIEWGWLTYERKERRAHWFRMWDGFIAVVVTLQVTLISFLIAFNPNELYITVVSYVLDEFNVVDICVNVWRNSQHDLRSAEFRRGRCRLDQYINKRFIVDILAIMPTDILCYGVYFVLGTTQVMPALAGCRANRLLCLYKVFRYLNFMESHVGARMVAIRSLMYASLTWFILHLSACVWYLIPCHNWSFLFDDIILCSAPSWIYSGHNALLYTVTAYNGTEKSMINKNIYAGRFDHGLGTTDWVILNATVAQTYVYSLYWTITTATTVGLGDVHGVTFGERLFSLFVQLEGTLVLFGLIQGGITSMLTNFDVNQFRYKMRVMAIIKYLQDQNQPSELVRVVTNFYRYLWERSRGMSSSGLFDQLPFALRSEISMELTGQIFDKSPLFQNINASFLRMLSLKFRPMLALPDQIVMQRGELCDLMVYVQKGELEVLSDDDLEIPTMLMKPGKLVGEVNLITRMPRKYSIRAIGHCDLVVLRTEDLMACLHAYPDVAEELRHRAEERAGMTHEQADRPNEGVLASAETFESAKQKKQQKDLADRLKENEPKMGTNMRSLLSSFKIRRPQETLKISKSMELYRIRDPMDELVEFHTSTLSGRMKSRYRSLRQAYGDFSIDPDGLFYYFWERLIFLVIIITFFLYTYVAFFQSYDDLFTSTSGYVILTFGYIMDILVAVDFLFSFFKQINTANGKIKDHSATIGAYVHSTLFWVDLLALLPLEILLVGLELHDGESENDFYTRQTQMLGYLRLNRCLKILVVPKFFDKIQNDLTTSTAMVRLIKFSIYILVSAQLGAALLIAGSCTPNQCPIDKALVWTAPNPPNITTDSTAEDRYRAALYYAVTLLTTTGYGDIFPHNILEQCIASAVMLLGVLVYGYAIAVLTATLANLDGPRVEFQDRLFALKNFMEHNKMAETVKQRAMDSVALLWTISKGEDVPGVKSMTHDLPAHLTEEIQVEDLIHLVAGVPIFKNLEEHILKAFAPAIQRYLFPPGEFIIQHGDLIHELFVIRRGVCQIYHPEHASMVIGELHPGMYFGEIGFLFNKNEIVSVKTVTHCEVLTIPRPEFDKAVAGVRWFSHQMTLIGQNTRYYEDMVSAARQAKPLVKKKREESLIRLTRAQKRRLEFRDDFNSLSVHYLTSKAYELLLNYTFAVDGRFLYIWEIIRVLESTLLFILVLIQVTFDIQQVWYFVTLYLLDLYAIVDIYVKFHVQYYNETNVLVTHPYMTATRYLRSNFCLDLLAVIPLEMALLFTPGGTVLRPDLIRWAMYLRLNRTLQIYRVPLAFAFMEADIKREQATTFLLKFTNYFIIVVFFAMSMPLIIDCQLDPCGTDISSCNATSFIETPVRACMDSSYFHTTNVSSADTPWTQFVVGFYWAVTTTAIVGYGDIYAANSNERVLFLVTMIAGYAFFGYIIASIAAAQANSDARRSRFFDRLMAIKQYMQHEHLPKKLRVRILHYYEYLWLRTNGVDPKTLIIGLPPSLTAELALQLYRKVIEQVSIFKNTPTGLKKMLAAIVKPLYVMEGEYVIRVDDTGSDLFFLFRGTIEVHYCNGFKSSQLVRTGRMLGEVAFFTNEVSKISCKAKENSDLYYVTRTDFDNILEHFPEIKDSLMEELKANMEKDDEFKMNTAKNISRDVVQQKRKGYRDSLAAVRKKKLPFKQLGKLIMKHTFRPDDQFIRYFCRYLVNALRVISVMVISYQPAFAHYAEGFYAIHYLLEVVFFVSHILETRTGFIDEFGNEVMAKERIVNRYLKTKHGLLMDVITCFPYEIFALAFPPFSRRKAWAYLQLIRVPTRLYCVIRFFKQWLAELDINVLFVRLLYTITQLFLWLHVFACLAYYIACPDGACDHEASWVGRTELRTDHEETDGYVITLYWIVTTATTTGYGDIVPRTNGERFFICFVQVMGKFLFGIIVGDIASTLANLEISRQNFESKFQAIRTYLLDQQANQSIIDRVQKYFDYLWTIDRGVDDIQVVLADAPFCLRTEVCYTVHQRDLRELPLFRDASNAFIRMVSAVLHQVQFVPGDYIIQQGDLVEEMYFLHRGEAVEVDNGVEKTVVRRGSNVNWQALLIDWPASRTVRATDNCEVYVLARTEFEQVVSKYNEEMGNICTTNRIRLRDLLEEEKIDID